MDRNRRPKRRAALLSLALILAVPTPALAADKMVALTFDDGPSSYTSPMMRELREKGVPGTFFVVGKEISGRESLLQRMVGREHEIGNHSWSHPDLTRLSRDQIKSQLGRTDRAIEAAVAPVGDRPDVFRPPYGAVNAPVREIARDKGMRTVLWDVGPNDWSRPGASTIYRRVVRNVGDQSIVLLHDGGGPRGQTVNAVPLIIDELRERGYRFVTVSQFLEAGGSTQATGVEEEPRAAYE